MITFLAHFWVYKALRVLPAETRLTVYRRPRVCACLRACVSVCLRSFLQACVRIFSWRAIASIRLCICFFSVLTFVSAFMCACLRVCMRLREHPAVGGAEMSGFWTGKFRIEKKLSKCRSSDLSQVTKAANHYSKSSHIVPSRCLEWTTIRSA